MVPALQTRLAAKAEAWERNFTALERLAEAVEEGAVPATLATFFRSLFFFPSICLGNQASSLGFRPPKPTEAYNSTKA